MQITIVNVDITSSPGKNGKKGWDTAEVAYKDHTGQLKSKKIVSFANPQTFAALKDAKNGDQFVVTSVKDDAGYYQWTSVTAGSESSAPASKPAAVGGAQPTAMSRGSTYETPEERAIKQRLIVRQSSLAQAIEFHRAASADGLTEQTILDTASRFSSWVYEPTSLIEMEDDIPY